MSNYDLNIILSDLKAGLLRIYSANLEKVILYGSYARGEQNEDSDIDLLVVLKEMGSPGREIDKMIDVVYDVNLKYKILISVIPVSSDDFRNINSPLLLNIRKEGIAS